MRNALRHSSITVVALTLALVAVGGCGSGSSSSSGGGSSSGSTAPSCGDGQLQSDEQCDDGNQHDGDGCSSACQVESGWSCPNAGSACAPALCGDGIVVGDEQCDDGNGKSGDGCSATCQLEGSGWSCATPGQACAWTKCGDGTVQGPDQGGPEQCDDGNAQPFDGCYHCQWEPQCSGGACTATCGDGIITAPEECDDGNTLDGDGCSKDCQLEPASEGWVCTVETSDLPDYVDVPIILRDFLGVGTSPVPAGAAVHQDFEHYNNNLAYCLVKPDLDPEGKPEFNSANGYSNAACTTAKSNPSLTTPANFAQWYRDGQTDGGDLLDKTVVSSLRLTKQVDPGTGVTTYQYDSAATPLGRTQGTGSSFKAGFFPLDDDPNGWGIYNTAEHDFHFTTQARYWFTYEGGERLDFSGDDDVWVFINGRLAVDIGGVHGKVASHITLTLDPDGTDDNATRADDTTLFGKGHFGMTKGGVYQMDLFHAERHTTQSNFWLTLGGFVKAKTTCRSVCGDGMKAPDEQCDHGASNGSDGDTCDSSCHLRGGFQPR